MAESTDLAVVEPTPSKLATYLPGVSPAEAREAMVQYQAVCEAVLTPEDYQDFSQWDSKTRTKRVSKFKKKSAVKKLQTFWNVSVEIKETWRDDLGAKDFGFRVTATARLPNGRVVEALGACSSLEERFQGKGGMARAYHDVLATAETRATNRAVMNCIGVGGGEITADEATESREPDPDALAEEYAREQARAAKELPLEERLRRRIFALCGELGWDDSRRHEEQSLMFGSSSLNELNEEQLKRFGQHLAGLKEKK